MGKRTFAEIEKTDNAASFYPTTENYVFTHSVTLFQEGFIPIEADGEYEIEITYTGE